MRITHITIIHPPGEPRILHKQCRTLAEAGHEVHLVGWGPSRELEGVFRHSLGRYTRRPTVRDQLPSLVRAAIHAVRLWPSAYHLHDPHLIPLGLLLKLAGARVIYDVHEDYQAHVRTKLFDRPVRARAKAFGWRVIEALARRTFDRFVCASPALAQSFPSARTIVVGNFPNLREFGDTRALPYRERPNTLVANGYLTEVRCFWEIATALELVPAELGCRLRVVGKYRPPSLEQRARERRLGGSVDVLGWQPHATVVHELLRAKVGVVVLRALPNHGDPLRSTKLFEYMAAGIPMIVADMPRWRELVGSIGCGLIVDPRDPTTIAAAIEYLLRNPEEAEQMGARGRRAVEREFNWHRDASRLVSLYRDLASRELAPVAIEA